MTLPLSTPPESICLLRLSAIGDICHVLPVIRTLQAHWPKTRITWIIGKTEFDLVKDIAGLEFIIFDKSAGFKAYRRLHRKMKGRRFGILLHMQMSLRASLASLLIPADVRLGFDRRRANDFQWLFVNHRITYRDKQHVMDSFLEFVTALGIKERLLKWDIPISHETRKSVDALLPTGHFIVISPCSSMSYRNWAIEKYAAVADYATQHFSLPTVLTGGNRTIEKSYGENIEQRCQHKPVNLIGKTSLKQLVAVLERAEVVIAPDSGPAHLATAVNTPVIGLYATTNPDRARPYLYPELVINRYPEAVHRKYGKSVDDVRWGTRVRDADAMERISVADVTGKLDQFFEG